MRRLKKKIFLGLFGGTVALLGAIRLAFPQVTGNKNEAKTTAVTLANDTSVVGDRNEVTLILILGLDDSRLVPLPIQFHY